MPIPIPARIFGGTAMLTGASAFGYFGMLMLRKSYKLATQGIATTGTIIGSELQLRAGASQTLYAPKVEFQTARGERVTFVASVGSNAAPKTGRKVKVLYIPDNPQDADVNSLLRSWLFPLLMVLTGGCFLFGAVMFYTNVFGQAR